MLQFGASLQSALSKEWLKGVYWGAAAVVNGAVVAMGGKGDA